MEVGAGLEEEPQLGGETRPSQETRGVEASGTTTRVDHLGTVGMAPSESEMMGPLEAEPVTQETRHFPVEEELQIRHLEVVFVRVALTRVPLDLELGLGTPRSEAGRMTMRLADLP